MRARDATNCTYTNPADAAKGKSIGKSLLQPQELAHRLLPEGEYMQLFDFATKGAPAECGEPWPQEVIEQALRTGPHVSAMTPSGVELLWEDIQYQEKAGFVKIIPESALRRHDTQQLKVSRVAIVPQQNRRDRIILNLSAEVKFPATRRKKARIHPSVNETTAPAADQRAVKRLGSALHAILRFAFEVDCTWEILWQKVDLSDGFWRMVVEAGKELNFVFEIPARPGDTQRYFVVPSSLQMGWTNSPPYFCTATEAGRLLLQRILAFSLDDGLDTPHPGEKHCLSADILKGDWLPPLDLAVVAQVFVDDFVNGMAGPVGRLSLGAEQRWLARATLHAVHAIFPPPEVLDHQGGKDSISQKKVLKGDARFAPRKELLGLDVVGAPGKGRVVILPQSKKEKYQAAIRQALDSPAYRVSMKQYQRILGKLIYAANVIPSMNKFFTPLYQELQGKGPESFVGLGKRSVVREVLELLDELLELASQRPSHITELVSPDLPHFYGTVDASGEGFGGVMLPCTHWIAPAVWRLAMPKDLREAVANGTLTMVDCEFVGYFIHNCMLHDMAEVALGTTAGMTSHTYSDNSPSVAILQRGASRAKSPTPARVLRWLAILQRIYRNGPQDIQHWEGKTNLMADFPSRSFASFATDAAFMEEFSRRFPLPPQLRCWTLVRPRTEICSAAFCLLRQIRDSTFLPAGQNGDVGLPLPAVLGSIPTSLNTRDPPSTWNASTCSWPLLLPCGRVIPTAESPLLQRRSREPFVSADKPWQVEDLRTLAKELRVSLP